MIVMLSVSGYKVCGYCHGRNLAAPGFRYCLRCADIVRREVRRRHWDALGCRTIYSRGAEQLGRPQRAPIAPLDVPAHDDEPPPPTPVRCIPHRSSYDDPGNANITAIRRRADARHRDRRVGWIIALNTAPERAHRADQIISKALA